ncbi:MAG: hypothetical protein V3W41_14440 [Planctomycetota bacterium]
MPYKVAPGKAVNTLRGVIDADAQNPIITPGDLRDLREEGAEAAALERIEQLFERGILVKVSADEIAAAAEQKARQKAAAAQVAEQKAQIEADVATAAAEAAATAEVEKKAAAAAAAEQATEDAADAAAAEDAQNAARATRAAEAESKTAADPLNPSAHAAAPGGAEKAG